MLASVSDAEGAARVRAEAQEGRTTTFEGSAEWLVSRDDLRAAGPLPVSGEAAGAVVRTDAGARGGGDLALGDVLVDDGPSAEELSGLPRDLVHTMAERSTSLLAKTATRPFRSIAELLPHGAEELMGEVPRRCDFGAPGEFDAKVEDTLSVTALLL